MAEPQWLAYRLRLRTLLLDYPDWPTRQLAAAAGCSPSSVKKWRPRILAALDDPQTCLGRSRRPTTTASPFAPEGIAAALEIRDQPPSDLNCTPGPKTIQYYLRHNPALAGLRLPKSTRTYWQWLRQAQRIVDRPKTIHTPVPPSDPWRHWQFDFKDAPSVPPDPDGKQQHMVEILNVLDVGTSILVHTQARADWTATTVIEALAEILVQHGLPAHIQYDRDARFVGGAPHPDWPSPLTQLFLCLGVAVTINPPRQPQKNGHVERYHKSLKYECLRMKQPRSLDEVQDAATAFQQWYNDRRPHQGRSCGNQPPTVAHPDRPALPSPPLVVDPDRWVDVLDGTTFVRRVQQNGTIAIYDHTYYLGQALAGQEVTIQLEATQRELVVYTPHAVERRFPLKGLVGKVLTFTDFVAYLRELARQGAIRARQTPGALRQQTPLQRHTPLQSQTPLERRTPLKRRTALRCHTPLRRTIPLRRRAWLRRPARPRPQHEETITSSAN